MPLNSTIPGTSTLRSTARTTASRDGAAPNVARPGVTSAGNQCQASMSPTAVIGTLTRKIAGQPVRATRNPPSTGPSATLTDEVMLIAPSVPAGAWPWGSPARMIASPAGYAAEVPHACSIRQAISHPKAGARGASTLATPTNSRPMQKMRRGPNRSANRPIKGWATAAAIAKLERSHDAVAMLTAKSDWISTRTTAIIDELSGFSSVPASTALRSRRPGRRAQDGTRSRTGPRAGYALAAASEAARRPRRRPATRSTKPRTADPRAMGGWLCSCAILVHLRDRIGRGQRLPTPADAPCLA